MHLKLDEVIRSARKARNDFIDLEDCTDEELEALRREFAKVREKKLNEGRGANVKTSLSSETR